MAGERCIAPGPPWPPMKTTHVYFLLLARWWWDPSTLLRNVALDEGPGARVRGKHPRPARRRDRGKLESKPLPLPKPVSLLVYYAIHEYHDLNSISTQHPPSFDECTLLRHIAPDPTCQAQISH